MSFSSQNCFCRSVYHILFSFTLWCRQSGHFKFHILLVSSFAGRSVLVSLLFVLLNLFQFAVIGHFVPTVYPVLCVLPYSTYAQLEERCTNPKGQVPRLIKFCTVVLNICGCSVWNLLQVPVLAPSILRTLLDFWQIYVSLCKFRKLVTKIMKSCL